MGIFHGNDGIVKVATATVLEVQDWAYDEEDVAPAEQTSMGDTVATPIASGCKRGKGTITCYLDEDDSTGQNVLFVIGATVALKLYPEGEAVTDMEYAGNVVVRTVGRAVEKTEINKITFTFDGALTRAAVTT